MALGFSKWSGRSLIPLGARESNNPKGHKGSQGSDCQIASWDLTAIWLLGHN